MEPPDAIISVRSEKQAMDWSLVLVSQGIETALDRSPEDGQWRLVVPGPDLERAWTTLRLYERENRRRRWQQSVRWAGLLFDWRVVSVFVPIATVFVLTDVLGNAGLKSAGLMDTQAVRAGQWWRLFTAVSLHADVGHLASNLATGVLLLGLAMGSYGAGRALLASYLAGAGGNLGGLLFAEPHRSLGASGMVLGALGLLTVQSLSLWRSGANSRQLVGRAILAGILLLVLFGLNPQSDVGAHVGGFVFGAALGVGLVFLPERWMGRDWVDRLATVVSAGLFVLTWLLAFRV